MPPILNKWLWDKAGFTLAILVLVGAVLAWILPFFPPLIGFIVALAEIALAVVVVVKESRTLSA